MITIESSGINSIFSATKIGIGFIDEVGGSVDGLMSCTESLGFESSDERMANDHIGSLDDIDELCSRKSSIICSKPKAKHVKKEIKNFPPPLSSLSEDGKPTFFLRPVRRDGRLKLTEVKISRPEILRASRQDGRLKLHLICGQDDDEDIQEEPTDVDNEMKLIQESVQDMDEKKEDKTMQLEAVEEVEEEEEEEESAEEWQLPGSGGVGDGFRRCYKQVNQHRHGHGGHHQHELHLWRQHFVTIR